MSLPTAMCPRLSKVSVLLLSPICIIKACSKRNQLARLKATFPSVKSWFACFDNDPTGNCFDVTLAYALNGKTCKAYTVPEAPGLPSKIVHISHSKGEKESFREADFSSKKYLDDNGLNNIQIIKPSRGKDWNDQLINYKRFDLNLAPTAKINQLIDSCISQLNLRGYHQLTDTILAGRCTEPS
ncbi:hypothetical protein AWW74_12290 [Streptococcus pneumoniae]|nr:hypothetical protein AWW74_12290 [Streptococcus pneumoniae]